MFIKKSPLLVLGIPLVLSLSKGEPELRNPRSWFDKLTTSGFSYRQYANPIAQPVPAAVR